MKSLVKGCLAVAIAAGTIFTAAPTFAASAAATNVPATAASDFKIAVTPDNVLAVGANYAYGQFITMHPNGKVKELSFGMDNANRPVFEVEGIADGMEHELKFALENGQFVAAGHKQEAASSKDNSKTFEVNNILRVDVAMNIAYNDVGIDPVGVNEWSVKKEGNKVVYEVELNQGQTKYEVKIDGITGQVLSNTIDK